MTIPAGQPAAFENSLDAFSKARHFGRYAHHSSLVWRGRDGLWRCQRYGREAIKAALLACGTRGHFYDAGSGPSSRVGWREGVLRLRNAHHVLARI